MKSEHIAAAITIALVALTSATWASQQAEAGVTTLLAGCCGVALIAWVGEGIESRKAKTARKQLESRINHIASFVLEALDQGVELDRVPEIGCSELGSAPSVQPGSVPEGRQQARKNAVRKALKV